jgi:hypothetical protein
VDGTEAVDGFETANATEAVDGSEVVDETQNFETFIKIVDQVVENRSGNMETRINGIKVSTQKRTPHEKLRN